MPSKNHRIYYERELPHYQPLDGTYATMFRLAGSLPITVMQQLREERESYKKYISGMTDSQRRSELLREHAAQQFEKFQSLLDTEKSGPRWLSDSNVAKEVGDSIHYWNARAYELLCYCIMPNHVHLIFSIGAASTVALPEFPLKGQTPYAVTNILSSIKKHSSLRANKLLNRSGAFWQDESYDHFVRDGKELERQIWYALLNPSKAGLVNDWQDWRWSYVKEGLI